VFRSSGRGKDRVLVESHHSFQKHVERQSFLTPLLSLRQNAEQNAARNVGFQPKWRRRILEMQMDTTTLLIIILVLLLLGGGGWYGRGRWY
jgi:hypothetical protein